MRDCRVEECPACGNVEREYEFNLGAGLLNALLKLYDAGPPASINQLGLVNNEFGNFAKLAYFGLTVSLGKHTGMWDITGLGYDWLAGRRMAPKKVRVFKKEVTWLSEELVSPKDVRNDFAYKRRDDYLADSREDSQGRLFE